MNRRYPNSQAMRTQTTNYTTTWPSGIGAQPSAETVAAWTPPAPELPEIDQFTQVKSAQKSREQLAREALLDCKGKAFLALVAGGMSQTDANEAGTELILKLEKQGLLGAYEVAGGNAKAKAELIAAIEADPPAWWGPAFLAIFEDAL